MKLLFITDNFPPEVNAPASRTFEHCKEWAKSGLDVTVITCFPNFPFGKVYKGYKNVIIKREEMEGIKVIRVWSFMAPNKGFIIRTLDFISFSISAFLCGLTIKTDLIVATSPQFFTAIAGRKLGFFKKAPWVMEVRDLWPEQVLASTNVKRNFLIRYFEWQEKRCYKAASLIVTVTNSFVDKIRARGITENKFIVVRNGVDRKAFFGRDKNHELLSKLHLEGKFVVGYIGTHGVSQNLSFIIDSICEINDPSVTFLFLGEGAEKTKVEKLAKKLGVMNILFLPQVSKERVIDYLSLVDVSLVPLRKSELYKSVIPSKIFENAGMKIPILLGVDGEARQLVEKYGSGIYYDPDNKQSFLKAFEEIRKPSIYAELQKGCEVMAKDFDRQKLARYMQDSLTKVIK